MLQKNRYNLKIQVWAVSKIDISLFLVHGKNKIEVHVTQGQLNGFAYKAKQGDNHYRQFDRKQGVKYGPDVRT